MGAFWHVLKRTKTNEQPRNWCYVDTEAWPNRTPDGKENHTLRLGVSFYARDSRLGRTGIEAWDNFRTPDQYWRIILDRCERDRKLLVVAYNAGYDVRILQAFRCLAELGYEQTGIYSKGGVFIASWKRDKHRICFIDAMNFFEGKLEKWGDTLGIPKLDIDFDTKDDASLFEYCKRDVLILKTIMEEWRSFLLVHDLGHFCLTKSAQSLCAFQHRFMTKKVYIHAHPLATWLERKSYHGGRTECFHVGPVPGGPFWKLDINSMYPSVMVSLEVPTMFKGICNNPTLSACKEALTQYCLCAEVSLKTDDPAYAFLQDGKLIYPVGTFKAVLSTPEFKYALERNHITHIGTVSYYTKAVLFDWYVRYMYPLRQAYKAEGNELFSQMTKYFLLGLYGKWGQKGDKLEQCPKEDTWIEGENLIYDADDHKTTRVIVVEGIAWRTKGTPEARHSFPAIASHITSEARIRLHQLICEAGQGHCFYTDTDSLFVDRTGYERLRSYLDETRLGALKTEYVTSGLTIFTAKDYKTDHESKIKGVPKTAKKVSPNTWNFMQWQRFQGAMSAGNLKSVKLTPSQKRLARSYTKGTVDQSGSVSPLLLAEA